MTVQIGVVIRKENVPLAHAGDSERLLHCTCSQANICQRLEHSGLKSVLSHVKGAVLSSAPPSSNAHKPGL